MKQKKCSNCKEPFTPQRPLQKTCGYQCAIEISKKLQKVIDAKKKPIKRLSDKRNAQNKEYLKKRATFLKNKVCPVTGQEATEIHHMKGRIGKLLTDEKFWLAVSRKGHIEIENNPLWAYEQGFSMKRI